MSDTRITRIKLLEDDNSHLGRTERGRDGVLVEEGVGNRDRRLALADTADRGVVDGPAVTLKK